MAARANGPTTTDDRRLVELLVEKVEHDELAEPVVDLRDSTGAGPGAGPVGGALPPPPPPPHGSAPTLRIDDTSAGSPVGSAPTPGLGGDERRAMVHSLVAQARSRRPETSTADPVPGSSAEEPEAPEATRGTRGTGTAAGSDPAGGTGTAAESDPAAGSDPAATPVGDGPPRERAGVSALGPDTPAPGARRSGLTTEDLMRIARSRR